MKETPNETHKKTPQKNSTNETYLYQALGKCSNPYGKTNTKGDSNMGEEKEYGLLIAAIVSIVAIVGLVILFSRGAPTGKLVSVQGAPWTSHYTGAGSTYEENRGFPDYRDCIADKSCPTGRACWDDSGTGANGGYSCEPRDSSSSPYSSLNTASGRGQLIG